MILIGLVSVVKYVFVEFSLNDAEGKNILLRIFIFILFNSISISGLIAIVNARAAWMALLLTQLLSTIILAITTTFGRGNLTLNAFTLQHIIVAVVALVLLILLDFKYRAGKK
ncbi:MAG: hypothetical protein ABIU18_06925 [Novosphingobium sp.]